MKIIKYISKSKLGKNGMPHYVLYQDGNYYSWEWKFSFFKLCEKGEFHIYNEIEFKNDCEYCLYEINIKSFDISKYLKIKKNGFNCIEIIKYILYRENIEEPFIISTDWRKFWKKFFIFFIFVLLSFLYGIFIGYTKVFYYYYDVEIVEEPKY